MFITNIFLRPKIFIKDLHLSQNASLIEDCFRSTNKKFDFKKIFVQMKNKRNRTDCLPSAITTDCLNINKTLGYLLKNCV